MVTPSARAPFTPVCSGAARFAAPLLGVLLVASTAHAQSDCTLAGSNQFYGTADRAAFMMEFPAADVIDFEQRADGSTPQAGDPFDPDEFSARGVRITVESADPSASLIWAGNPVGGFSVRLSCDGPFDCNGDIVFTFASDYAAVGMDYPGNTRGQWRNRGGGVIYDSGNISGSGSNFMALHGVEGIGSVRSIRQSVNDIGALFFADACQVPEPPIYECESAAGNRLYLTGERGTFFSDFPAVTSFDFEHRADGSTPQAGDPFDPYEFVSQGLTVSVSSLDPTARLIWAGNPVGGFSVRLQCDDFFDCTGDIVFDFASPFAAAGMDYPGNTEGQWRDPEGNILLSTGDIFGSGSNFMALHGTGPIAQVRSIRQYVNDIGAVHVASPCVADPDSDGDGTPDSADGCPNDPGKVDAGTCGCGKPEDVGDDDGDGTVNCLDGCPNTPELIAPTEHGCVIPRAPFNLQVLLTDDSGRPLSGPQEVTIRIYGDSNGDQLPDSTLYEATFPPLPSTDGRLSLTLDPPAAIFDGRALLVGVQPNDSSVELQPLIRIMAAPLSHYATRAGDAASFGGAPPEDFAHGFDRNSAAQMAGYVVKPPYSCAEVCAQHGQACEGCYRLDSGADLGCGSDPVPSVSLASCD